MGGWGQGAAERVEGRVRAVAWSRHHRAPLLLPALPHTHLRRPRAWPAAHCRSCRCWWVRHGTPRAAAASAPLGTTGGVCAGPQSSQRPCVRQCASVCVRARMCVWGGHVRVALGLIGWVRGRVRRPSWQRCRPPAPPSPHAHVRASPVLLNLIGVPLQYKLSKVGEQHLLQSRWARVPQRWGALGRSARALFTPRAATKGHLRHTSKPAGKQAPPPPPTHTPTAPLLRGQAAEPSERPAPCAPCPAAPTLQMCS